MPRGTYKVCCKICYDAEYSKALIFVENIDKHYKDANARFLQGEDRIPPHIWSEHKYYVWNVKKKTIDQPKKSRTRKQTSLFAALQPQSPSVSLSSVSRLNICSPAHPRSYASIAASPKTLKSAASSNSHQQKPKRKRKRNSIVDFFSPGNSSASPPRKKPRRAPSCSGNRTPKQRSGIRTPKQRSPWTPRQHQHLSPLHQHLSTMDRKLKKLMICRSQKQCKPRAPSLTRTGKLKKQRTHSTQKADKQTKTLPQMQADLAMSESERDALSPSSQIRVLKLQMAQKERKNKGLTRDVQVLRKDHRNPNMRHFADIERAYTSQGLIVFVDDEGPPGSEPLTICFCLHCCKDHDAVATSLTELAKLRTEALRVDKQKGEQHLSDVLASSRSKRSNSLSTGYVVPPRVEQQTKRWRAFKLHCTRHFEGDKHAAERAADERGMTRRDREVIRNQLKLLVGIVMSNGSNNMWSETVARNVETQDLGNKNHSHFWLPAMKKEIAKALFERETELLTDADRTNPTGRPRRMSSSKDKGTTKESHRRCDTVNIKYMFCGKLVIRKAGFTRITNQKGKAHTFGTGRGQALNYAQTFFQRMSLSRELLRNIWVSASYDNACFHDRVPQYCATEYRLPPFHQSVRDPNHSINIAVEKSLQASPFTLFIGGFRVQLSFFAKGSNDLIAVWNYANDHDLKFETFKNLSVTKWCEHQNRSYGSYYTNLESVQHLHASKSAETTKPGRRHINAGNISRSAVFLSYGAFLLGIFNDLQPLTKLLQADAQIGYEVPRLVEKYLHDIDSGVAGYRSDIARGRGADTLAPTEFAGSAKFELLQQFHIDTGAKHITFRSHSVTASKLEKGVALTHNNSKPLKFDFNKKVEQHNKEVLAERENQRANLNTNARRRPRKSKKKKKAPAKPKTMKSKETHAIGTTLIDVTDFSAQAKKDFFALSDSLQYYLRKYYVYPDIYPLMHRAFDLEKWSMYACTLLAASRRASQRRDRSILLAAEQLYAEYGQDELLEVCRLHNASYSGKFAVDVNKAMCGHKMLKQLWLHWTLRGSLTRSWIEEKEQMRKENRNKPVHFRRHWEFVRLVFVEVPQVKGHGMQELLFVWESCLVQDCGEPSNEGSVSILDNIIAGRGRLGDEQLLHDFVIKTLYREFDGEYDKVLLDKVITRWLKAHPSPVCGRTKFKFSRGTDKIKFSRNKKRVVDFFIMRSLTQSETEKTATDKTPQRSHFTPVTEKTSERSAFTPASDTTPQLSHFPSAMHQLYLESNIPPLMRWRMTGSSVGSGLCNLGNSCFMNATLQCLCYTAPFQNYLATNHHTQHCKTSGKCIFCVLQELMPRMLRSQTPIEPRNLFESLPALSNNKLRCGRQEDAQEFLRLLMNELQNNTLKEFGLSSSTKDKRAQETTVMHKLWGGYLRSQIKCRKCHYESNTYDSFLDISLEIKGRRPSVLSAFKHFTDPEMLDDDNKYHCTRCKKARRATKKLTISEPPNVLCVHLKRFQNATGGGKINRHVEFADTLNLTKFTSDPTGARVSYSLFGVLVHYGDSSHVGHYNSYIKSPDARWFLMDDEICKPIKNFKKEVLKMKAYLLFYQRNEPKVLNESLTASSEHSAASNID